MSHEEELAALAVRLSENILRLLNQVGDSGICTGPTCGARIWWVRHLNGKRVPYTHEALNHFVDCPDAQQFRKKEG